MTGDVPSPCIQVCRLGDDNTCLGCGRTIREIAGWRDMTPEQKRAVWRRLGREPRDETGPARRLGRALGVLRPFSRDPPDR